MNLFNPLNDMFDNGVNLLNQMIYFIPQPNSSLRSALLFDRKCISIEILFLRKNGLDYYGVKWIGVIMYASW